MDCGRTSRTTCLGSATYLFGPGLTFFARLGQLRAKSCHRRQHAQPQPRICHEGTGASLFLYNIMTKNDFLLVNKPVDWTSHDVVAYIRRQYPHGTRVGHAGTLDPFATGLLIVAVGRENTKQLDTFKNLPKTYEATVFLGATTNTFDSEGDIVVNEYVTPPTIKPIENTLKKFTGKIRQIPPMFSAKKINGQKLYNLARQGKEVERQPVDLEIYSLKVLGYQFPYLKIEVQCSAGTYIRSLANDIGSDLGTGAYCLELTRTAIGPHLLKDAKPLKPKENT